MKILGAGDLHGDAGLAKKLAEKADKEGVELVLLCGDLTMSGEGTKNLIGPFLKKGKKVLLLPGNHEGEETVDFLAEYYDVRNMHGYSVRYDDLGIFGCSGNNVGVHSISEKETFDLLKKGFEKVQYLSKKLMMTHVHPAESVAEKLTFLPANKAITEAVKKFHPDILLCSHAHEAEGLEETIGKTKVLHVGREGIVFDI